MQLSDPFHHTIFHLIFAVMLHSWHQPNKSSVKAFLEEIWYQTLQGEVWSEQGLSTRYFLKVCLYKCWAIGNMGIGTCVQHSSQFMKFQLLSSIVEVGIAMGNRVNIGRTPTWRLWFFFFFWLRFVDPKNKKSQEKNVMLLPTNSEKKKPCPKNLVMYQFQIDAILNSVCSRNMHC